MTMASVIAIACGGALGALARHGLTSLIGIYGILAVNILGCFLIGALMSFLALKTSMHQTAYLFLTVGVLGSFTTFSAFSVETFYLMDANRYWQAALYVAMSVGGGLGAFILGRFLVKTIL